MNRRDLLKFTLVSCLLAGCGPGKSRGRVGLALGGGGARGLAHIPMLEVLDELGIRPARIAGTSIGAVLGVMYASGMSGRQIRKLVDRLTVSQDESWLDSLLDEDVGRWLDWIKLKPGRGGFIETRPFVAFLEKETGVSAFEQLDIPLAVVATDFWQREQVVFDRGPLMPAVRASIAIPGLFEPVEHNGRTLVDGGLINPVPYDLLFEQCDFVIAIDVSGKRSPDPVNGPSYFETLFNTIQIMEAGIMQEKMKSRPPDVYLHPDLIDIRVLEFNRVDEIYEQAEPARRQLARQLREQLAVLEPDR